MDARDELRKLVISQKTATLPAEPAGPAFEDLHNALTEYDRYVSEHVIQAITGQEVDLHPEALSAVQAQANQALADPAVPTGRDLENYRKYKTRLDTMAGLLLESRS